VRFTSGEVGEVISTYMGKCKVRVRHLTLAPGTLGVSEGIVEEDGEEAEARQILDRERHYC
jgi:hypothetical protein